MAWRAPIRRSPPLAATYRQRWQVPSETDQLVRDSCEVERRRPPGDHIRSNMSTVWCNARRWGPLTTLSCVAVRRLSIGWLEATARSVRLGLRLMPMGDRHGVRRGRGRAHLARRWCRRPRRRRLDRTTRRCQCSPTRRRAFRRSPGLSTVRHRSALATRERQGAAHSQSEAGAP